ncbi:MAG TPA: carbon monoxide dehydrogenase subunit G [Nocardioides sp.]|nr:carbon monoxide dehydrogenase subunit G [Nocardioides sp.]HET9841076.1 carbon monoxide dehydrogenase subunit G [Nocardioides sp.]
MKIVGHDVVPFPVEKVWDALLDPAVLVRTIPGCERLETTGENTYAMTVTAGVAAIRGTYDGTCSLSDLKEHESLVMRLQGAGAPGTIDTTVQVSFEEPSPGETRISYDADAVVGGMVGGVGQRMLGSVSKRMAGEFFGNVAAAIGGAPVATAAAPSAQPAMAGGEVGQVFTAPPRPAPSQQDFLKGIAVGAGLVLLGVVAGGIFGRRRR